MSIRKSKSLERRLQQLKNMTTKQSAAAMNAASEALDRQQQEIGALKRILVSERAQVIYYTDKYQACLERKCFDAHPIGWMELKSSEQEPYVRRAVLELSGDQGIVMHDEPKTLIKPN